MNIMKFIKIHLDGKPEILLLKVTQSKEHMNLPRTKRKPTRREAIILACKAGFTPVKRVHNTVKTFVRRTVNDHAN